MDKEQLIQELGRMMINGEVSQEELAERFGLNQNVSSPETNTIKQESRSHFSVTKMLYFLGASIVVIGVVIFIAQLWDDMGVFSQIVITLGLGLIFTGLGSMLAKQKPEAQIGSVFHTIGGVLIPSGALVTLDSLDLTSDWSVTNSFILIFIFYLLLNFVHKHAILTFFAIANGTTALYLLVITLFDQTLRGSDMEVLIQYLTMAIGVSYLLLAWSFRQGWNQKLVGFLHFFGVTGFLGAAFFRVLDSGFWELFYFLVVFGGVFLSVYMKSRITLIMSTIFLIVHVSYITSEYFANSLGWPLALVILGLIFIGLGYASITINNKYIKGENQAE